MFERFRNRVLSRGPRRDAGPAPAKRLIVEELEPWILMSADAVPAFAVLDGPVTADPEVYELLEQPIATRVELVFIDARVAGDDAVLADLAARAASGAQLEVVVIDSGRDGLEQIDEALVGREDIAALHIVSHGEDGRLLLGAGVLDAAALDARAAELSGWRGALTRDADILLYGCDIGAGAGGLALVQTLSGLTGADVAASDDATGFAARGGDWDLEVQTGAIEADVVFSAAFQQSWDGTLPITTGASTSAATSGTAQNSLTFSHTVASGTDRLLVVSVAVTGQNTNITGVTYGGQALTFLGTATRAGGGGVKTDIWYLVAPPQGAANVVVQTGSSESIVAGATTFFDVDQTQPFGTPVAVGGGGNSISGTISSAAGELVIGAVAILNRTAATNGPGQTGQYGLVGTGNGTIYAGTATEPGAASVTMTGTASGGSGSAEWALLLAPIKPAPNNAAPVLDTSKSPALAAVTEDAGAPSGAVGTGIQFGLVDFVVPSGQVDNVSDADGGAVTGVAVIGADTTNGTWWYSTNNGGSWLALGAVSNTSARLLAADGTTRLYFQPNANFSGSIANAITFRAWDRTFGVNGGTANASINGGSTSLSTATDTASITVTAVNDAPTTTPVTLAPLAEDGGPRLITQAQLLANATDVDGNPLTATGLAIASGGGTLVNNGNGTWSYTPAANDSSSVSFSYTIGDGNGGTVAGSATLDLTPVNDPPTTTPVTLAPLAEDGGPRLITQAQLLANASDIEGDPLTATALAIASGGGSLVNNGNGTWTYTPALNDSSSVSFSYTISDGNGGTVAGSASLDLTPVNDPPTTTPVTLAPLAEDGAPRLITQAQLLANANDIEGDPLTATALAIASGAGSLVNNGNGTWTYTPAANDSSSVSFSYTISDGNGGTVAGSASLDLTPVNDPPTTTPVTLAPLAEDGAPRLITQAQLLANAGDIEGDPLTATALAIASGGGSLVNNGNGTWTYTPAANDSSSVSFSYTIGDGNGGTVAGSATLDLTPVNDPPTTTPVTLAPLAEDGGPRLITQAQLLANASDIEGDPLTATALAIASGAGSLVNNGNGTWTYTPAANDSSSVSFSYTIGDGNGGTVAGSATLDLTPVNDPPTTTPVTLAPLAEDGGPRLITNAQLIANAADVDGDPLTATGLAIVGGSGTLVDNGNGTWTYTPAANDSSAVSFSYTIGDGNGGTVAGSATLDLTPVNDAPTTTPVTLAPLAEDGGPRLITNAQLIANAADVDGDPLTATALAIVSGAGTLVDNGNGTWTYTPAANDSSSVAFSYTIGDGNGGSVAGSATLDLTPVNDAPTTSPVTLAPLAEDGGPRLITNAQLIANASDIDGDVLTATGLAIASGSGTLVDNGNGTWTYTPAANDSSSVAFSYTIGDGNGGTVAGSATLDLTPVNDPPTTTPVTLAPLAEDGGPRLITNAELTANAADIDGDALTASGLAIVSGGGTLVDNGNGTWTYTPAANDSSSVSFSYTIGDGNGGTAAGSATLDLTPVNDAPTTAPVTLAPLAEDGAPRLITNAQLIANAADVDGDPLTATGLAIVSGSGTLVDNGNGTWTFTPAANDSSSVSFSYTIGDGNGGSVAGSATLDLTPVNDAPTTAPVTLAPLAEDGGPRLITNAELVANASDVDGDLLTATGLAIASGNGALVDNGNGTWTYTPAANDSSSVSFSYTIGDGNGGTVAGSATLDLTPVNDAPTTTPVTLAPLAEDGGPRLITNAELTANAADVDGDPLTATALAIVSGAGTLVDNGNGTWTYTPAANDSSSVAFSYTIGDGNGGTVAGNATLDLTPVNDPPTTTPVTLAPLAEDGGPRLITNADLAANATDIDGDALTATGLAIVSGNGSLVDNGNGTWTYTPAANDASSVSFSYTIGDGNGGTVAGSATLDLTPVNDAPTTSPVILAPLAEDGAPRLITNAELAANATDIDGDSLTATGLAIVSGNGSLVDNGNGTWTYTPAANDSSSVSFGYTIADGNGGTVAGSATLDLTPVNDAPTTSPVTLAPLAEDGGPRLITNAELIASAADIDGDPLTATGLAIVSGNGSLVDNGNGTWTYTPAVNDASSVSFSYTIGDGNGGTVAGNATLDLIPVNDAPTTTPVTLAPLPEDGGPRLITNAELVANASDVEGDPLTAAGLAIASGSGALVDNGNGTWTYTPAANDSSSVSFSYTIGDGNGGTVAGSATLDLTPINDAPTTTPVTLAPLAEDGGPRLITNAELIANAVDVDGDALTATGLGVASGNGSLVDNGNGTWTYTPAANDSSSVSFSYTIDDGNGGTVAGSATLDLTPVNDAPTTMPVTLAPLAEDGGPRLITNAELVANASDLDGDALTATGLGVASGNGTLVDNGNGTWTYTPAANDASSVVFSYTISDGNGGTVAGSATLDLTPVNDAPTTTPVTLAPLAEDGGPRLITNAEFTANATDVDGDPLTAAALAIASGNGTLIDNGNGTWSYTPAANDSSSVSFSYTIGDGNGGTVASSATLDLTPVNDAPTTTPVTLAPLAEDGGPRLITNAELVANAIDVEGDSLTATGLAIASGGGSLVDNGNGTWTYTPAANDSSSVSFSYTIGDGNGGTVAGTATLDLTPVNDAPTTTPVTLAPLAEDGGPRLITNAELVANATDVEGDTLTATGVAIASGNGSLVDNGNGTWTYTPAADDSSAVSFSYTIGDGNGGTVAGTATLDLTPVNDAPTTTPVTLAPLAEDGGPRLITNAELVANAADVDGDPLTASGLAIVGGNGTLIDNGNGTWTYTPAADDSSSVSFSYTIGDGNGGTVAGSASLDLTPVNDAPTTTPVTLAPLAEDGGPRLITNAELVANASDIDGDALTATGLAIASGNGTLVDNGNGTWTYTPAANDASSVSFSYTIGDGNGGTVAGTATLDLTPVNDAPTTSPVTLAPLAEDGGARLITNAELVANASDIDGDALTATGLAIASGNGALVDNGNGTWTYTPIADDSSSVSFSYTISDGNGGTVAGTATLDLTPVNDAPTTTPVTLAPLAEDGGPRLITNAELTANAVDVDGDALTATGLAIATGNGALVDNGNGTWTYTPAPNDASSASFSYTIGDGNGGTVAGTATLDLTPLNDAPTTTPVTLAPLAEDGGPRLITSAELVANASDLDGDALTATALAITSGNGALVDNGNGTWTYTPAADDSSSVSFSYTIGDGNGGTVAGMAALDLTPVNDAPTTTPVTLAPLVEDGGPRLITNAELVANAIDIDGDPLTASGLAIASGNGTLVDNGNGTWTYTPAANDASSVSFGYTIADGNGGTVAGSATLDLIPVNDAPTTSPVTLAPLVEDGGPRLITNAELIANAVDIDGDSLMATGLAVVSGNGALVDNGNGTWTYTPAANDSSSVSFSYTIGDGNGGTVAGSATLDLIPVNDAPTTTPVTLAPLVEDGGPRLITNAELVANASDIDGDPLTVAGLAILSGSGTLVDNGNGTWTYTPAPNDASSVGFSYTIADGNGGTVAGSATLDLTPVNDAPTTTPVILAPLAEDGGPLLITNAELTANAADVDGDLLTATGLAIATGNGSLVDNGNGTWTYTPAANDMSSVSFSYTIADGNGGTVAGSAALDLTPVNDAPTTTPVTLAPLVEDGGPRLITNAELIANATDVDGDPLTAIGLAITGGNGTLVDNGDGTWTYTPAANDSSSVSFSYAIGDGNAGTVVGSATLDLLPANDVPTTSSVTLVPMLEDGGPRLIAPAELLANATDADGDVLTPTGLGVASGNGTLVDNGDGTWSYTPAADYSGPVTFLYTIGDGNGGSVAGSAMLDVTPVNDAPVVTSNGGGANANMGVDENTSAVTVITSLDVDGDAVQYSIIGGADAARFRIETATGALTFLSPPNYEAPTDGGGDNIYEVIVRAADGQGGSTTQTLQIAVGGVDEAPTVAGDAFDITDDPLLIVMTTRLLANDADPEGGPLQIVSLTSPLSGTLEQDASGGWRYTPAKGFTGNDRFTYTVADAGGRTATAEVVVVVSALAGGSDGAGPTTTLAATESAGASGPLGGAVAANALGGGALEGFDGTIASGPVDVAGAHASAVWTVEADERPPGYGDDAVADFAAEIEQQRVYDARHWAPPDQIELEQIAVDMNGNLIRLAMNLGLQDTSRSLAVFDETFQDMLDGVRRTDREVSEIAIGSGVAVGAGVIAWLLRGGALAASLLSVLPTWASFDPIPILARRQDDEEKPTPPPEDSSEAAVTRVLRPDALPPRQVRS